MRKKDQRKDGTTHDLTLVWQGDQYVCPVQDEIEDIILSETGSTHGTYFDPVYIAPGVVLQFSEETKAWVFRRQTLPEDDAAMALIHKAAQLLKKKVKKHP